MRRKKSLHIARYAVILFLLVLSSVMTGCRDNTAHLNIIGDTFYYDPDKMFDYESYFAELEAQARPETEEPIDITMPPDTEAVPVESESAVIPVTTEPAVLPIVTDTAPAVESGSDVTRPEAVTVYWVKGGEVWHISAKCPSLARSKTVLSGTVEAAMASGKARVCKRCGN